MNSWTWKPRVSRSSFSGSQGRATSRTTTRWFPTPRCTCLLLTPDLDHSSRERLGHGLGLADLAGLHDAGRQRHLGGPNDHRDVAGGDLGHADGRRADVHADPGPGHYAPSTWTDRSER